MNTDAMASKQQLVQAKRAAHGISDSEFHGDVKKCSEELSSLSHEMVHLLDRLEKENPQMAGLEELWKNALQADKLADRLAKVVFFDEGGSV